MFNFYFSTQDSQKKADTLQLFRWIAEGRFKPYTSNIVLEELEKASAERYNVMSHLVSEYAIEIIVRNEESDILTDVYVEKGIIPQKYKTDAQHIAIASVHKLNFVASYNFGHIVKLKTLNMTGLVNIRHGYQQIGLFSPTEVRDDDGR
ncbi:MAG: hypothetical protein LBU84_00545 [Prevotella sp.]|jgi:predicted nucleic acid-binding protein|nr:hypothetical protein [Prevotella sp.]